MKNYLGDYDLIAVSANNAESAMNAEQTLDTSMLVDKSTVISLDPRRENNKDELTGKEEPDTVYDLGNFSSVNLSFDKAQAQHFAFGYSYALGLSTPTGWGTGYKHAILPITSDITLPSFTAAQRLGLTIFKRMFASMYVDQVTATFAKDSWAKLSLSCKGSGKYTDNMYKEIKTGVAYNASTFTLAANGVEGSDADTRLDNVHQVRVLVPVSQQYNEVTVTAVSGATPAVLTITPQVGVDIQGLSKAAACVVTWVGHGLVNTNTVVISGITQAQWSALNGSQIITKITDDTFSIPVDTSTYTNAYVPLTDPGLIISSGTTTFEILYTPTEAAWATFPARVAETPLRVTDLVVTVGGKWNGTTFLGGRVLSEEIDSIEHTISNNLSVEYRPGGTGSYANYAYRQGRAQTIKLNRQMRDYILQERMVANETFGVHMKATGAEFETGKNYYVDIVFPKCAVLSAPISINGKILAEAGDLTVLQDDTYGSVIVEIANKVATYAA
jgi:hypothetical protein